MTTCSLQPRLQTYTPPKSRCPEGKGRRRLGLTAPRAAQSFLQSFVVSDSGAVSCAPQATDSDLYMLYVTVSDQANNVAEAMIPLYVGGLLEVNPATSAELHAEAGRVLNSNFLHPVVTNQFKYLALGCSRWCRVGYKPGLHRCALQHGY